MVHAYYEWNRCFFMEALHGVHGSAELQRLEMTVPPSPLMGAE
jgi:hypothetical protein